MRKIFLLWTVLPSFSRGNLKFETDKFPHGEKPFGMTHSIGECITLIAFTFQKCLYRKCASFLIFIFFASAITAHAQSNANSILRGVYNKLQKAKDYSVNAHIKVDMLFIRMMPIDAKIYFKQKDKFKVESKSIAIVPRQGFDQSSKMLADTNSYTAVAQGNEMIGNIQTTIINIIPLSDTADLILGKLYIDAKQNVILKSQLTTKSSGTILTEYAYGAQVAYGLPDQMIFSVDMKKFKIPKSVSADINNTSKTDDPKKDKKKGQIFITLTAYQVNKGIEDSVFKK
jgi:outer membrane lipoprotein-sorting protein